MNSIAERATALTKKAESWQFKSRDLAELMELYQQAIDGIDELADNLPASSSIPLIVRLDGKIVIKFDRDADAMARWIAGIME